MPKTVHEIDAFKDVCDEKECEEKLEQACNKLLACGHACPGHDGEISCLPCMQADCNGPKEEEMMKTGDKGMGQSGEDYCNICFVESLASAPCIKIGCGHVFHYECLKKKVQSKWHTPRIYFTFCKCPLCQKWITVEEGHKLAPQLKEIRDLFDDISKKSFERLKFEGMDKDKRLTEEGSAWFGKPEEYAMATFSYFMCYKCKKPYFGGKKNCEAAAEEQKDQKEFKPEELVCPKCSDVGMGNVDCRVHGGEYISFKCRFCCSIAVWFCFGTTHFCEPCHSGKGFWHKQPPVCKGKDECPLKVDHPPNGQEFSLGCGFCRHVKDAGSAHEF